MKKLSTGDDSTLENYIKLSSEVFGVDSPATHFLIEKAKNDPDGVKAVVIADESQMIYVLCSLMKGE